MLQHVVSFVGFLPLKAFTLASTNKVVELS